MEENPGASPKAWKEPKKGCMMSTTTTIPTIEIPTNLQRAQSCVSKYAFGNALCSLVPVPLFDLIAISGLQITMVSSLCSIYQVPFSREAVKSILFGLVGGLNSATVACTVLGSVARFVPMMWFSASVVTLPLVAAASTYAVGKVFIMHFEAGGTVLTFDHLKMREYFKSFYQEGLSMAQARAKVGK